MTKPSSAKAQLTSVWLVAVEDLMGMTEEEMDAELKELGTVPDTAAQQGKNAVEQATAQSRADQRARKRKEMEAARSNSGFVRDLGVTVEMARQYLTKIQAANDSRLTMAARNRSPAELSDEEALALYWQLQELSK